MLLVASSGVTFELEALRALPASPQGSTALTPAPNSPRLTRTTSKRSSEQVTWMALERGGFGTVPCSWLLGQAKGQ
jgi:hypothetical protein